MKEKLRALKNRVLPKRPRHRSLFLFGGALFAAVCSFYTDPDENGLSTILGGLAIVQGLWAVAIAHLGRKALADYPEADQRNLFDAIINCKPEDNPGKPIGAGLALIALAIAFVGLLMVFAPRAHAGTPTSQLPAGFAKYGPTLKAEQATHWASHPDPVLLAALVEQESCISLRHSKCWNPGARLKSAREEGAGMGQVTRAYRSDGSLRFDSLAGLRTQYREEMGELSWGNVYQRPDLQLRGMILMSRDAARPFRATPDKAMLAFGDAGYNGGVAGVQKERRACKLTTGCDPSAWFGNVELHCLKSR